MHKESFKNLFNTGSRELSLVFLARVRRKASFAIVREKGWLLMLSVWQEIKANCRSLFWVRGIINIIYLWLFPQEIREHRTTIELYLMDGSMEMQLKEPLFSE